MPAGERLRNAVRWLSENRPITVKSLDMAAIRFDLTPLEVEFLKRELALAPTPARIVEGKE